MTTTSPSHRSDSFGASARRLAACWLALLALMGASLALSYVPLGVGNVIAGLAIACVKTGLVAIAFMHLRSPASRAAAAIALFMLAVLVALSGVDHWTRRDDPAPVQPPRQIEPALTREPS